MSTSYIDMMLLKVFGIKSHFLCLSIAMLSIEFFCFVFLFGSQTEYSLIWIINKLNNSLFPLVAACTSREHLNGFSGFFSTPNFQVTSLSTADVPGISQFPAGTSLNLSSSIFDWCHTSTVPAIIILQEPVLQSQTLLQVMGISRSCCAVSLFLLQCTR